MKHNIHIFMALGQIGFAALCAISSVSGVTPGPILYDLRNEQARGKGMKLEDDGKPGGTGDDRYIVSWE